MAKDQLAMKLLRLIPVCILGCLLCALSTRSEAASNPYSEPITKRNVFQLGRAPTNITSTAQPQSSVRLCGIFALPGGMHAVLRLPPVTKSAGPATELSLIMGEGALADGLRVLEINAPAATVRIANHGCIQTLGL
jgi:hypothetical protein